MKLENDHKKTTEKHTKTWMPHNLLLNSELVNNEIREEIKRCLKMKENENTIVQNLRDTVRAVLREKYRSLLVYLN